MGVLKLPARACSPIPPIYSFSFFLFTYIVRIPADGIDRSGSPKFPATGPVRKPKFARGAQYFQWERMTRALFPIKIERLDVSQWIVAHGRLSARTTLRHNWMVTPESPDRAMWTQFNAAPYNGCATNMRYQANHFKLFL